MTSLYLPVIYGTVREGRKSIVVARYVTERLRLRPGVETRLFDPRDLPFSNVVLREWEMTNPPLVVTSFVAEMGRADGFVLVTPEYNFGVPGALKNLLDHLYDEWNQKPFGFVTVGGMWGGVRCADMLRQIVSGLQGVTVPMHVSVSNVSGTFAEDGPITDRPQWESRFDRFFEQVEWYARALKAARVGPSTAQSVFRGAR